MEIKKPDAIGQYNKFIKGVERADQYLSFYSVLRKTVKWSKKSAKLCSLQHLFVQSTLNENKKVKYKNFLHEVGRSWISEVQNQSEFNSDCQRSKQHQGDPNRTRQADCLVISEYTNWKNLLVVGREKGSILQDHVKCVLHIRSKVKLGTFVNSALFRFTKGLVFRNTIQ